MFLTEKEFDEIKSFYNGLHARLSFGTGGDQMDWIVYKKDRRY